MLDCLSTALEATVWKTQPLREKDGMEIDQGRPPIPSVHSVLWTKIIQEYVPSCYYLANKFKVSKTVGKNIKSYKYKTEEYENLRMGSSP